MRFFTALVLAWACAAAVPASAQPRPSSQAPDEPLSIAPRTPLFCDDGTAIQPQGWGDYGDFVEGMRLRYGGPYQATRSHAAGGDRYWAGFGIGKDELALFEMAPHQGGWVLRVMHETFDDGRKDVTHKGADLCGPLLQLLTDRMQKQEPDKYLARLKAIAPRIQGDSTPH